MSDEPGLEVQDLSVRYGGLVALKGVSLRAPRGRITGLIGPNGAGKTTMFNACTGWVRASGGSIFLDGVDLRSRAPAERARRGLGRTFQRIELFDNLNVAENVALGLEASLAGRNLIKQLWTGRGERERIAHAVEQALASCGIETLRHEPVWSLSTGERRMVELARALAGDFTILMLDEPSSGLDTSETVRLGRILTRATEQRDVGVLLVEHDMSLVMNICEYIYLVDFGQLIFEGTAAEVNASDVVRAAYLGAEYVDPSQGR